MSGLEKTKLAISKKPIDLKAGKVPEKPASAVQGLASLNLSKPEIVFKVASAVTNLTKNSSAMYTYIQTGGVDAELIRKDPKIKTENLMSPPPINLDVAKKEEIQVAAKGTEHAPTPVKVPGKPVEIEKAAAADQVTDTKITFTEPQLIHILHKLDYVSQEDLPKFIKALEQKKA